MIHRERMAAAIEGDFVLFLIGMRINKPLLMHKWFPVFTAMPRMLRELQTRPELGLLHHELWLGRTLLMAQYWRSLPQLLDYATSRDSTHLPAWKAFNQAVGTEGSVGIWHETYTATAGSFEAIYVNMPPFGLGKAGGLTPAHGRRNTAAGRLGREE
jgi:hypothetical protein